ncbi:hypothetical protein EDM80_14510 [bacterium]|nr:MAG: hypothetical protein EDM80_14510 [bacterium]RIK64669.1 MAG: hypothetical protein DCC64_03605 [Planctomycetota bacterium]
MTLHFPTINIKGDRARLLQPYRHATEALNSLVLPPGPQNKLKASVLKGLMPGRVDAWDAAFATLGLRYASEGFFAPTNAFLAALDREGFVPASLSADTGAACGEERASAPLMSYAEWELYRARGNRERLAHALPLLAADFDWREQHQRLANGLYAGTPEAYRLGVTSRFWVGGKFNADLALKSSWVDASCLQALHARCLMDIAHALGERELAARFEWAMRDLSSKINALLWSEGDGWYFDLDDKGTRLAVRSLASFWAIISTVAPMARAERQIGSLSDVTKFERAHPYSTLSAGEREYRGRDGRPLGVARSDFNVIGYEALHALERGAQADFNAEDHLARVCRVLADTHELFLAYDPDRDLPVSQADGATGANASLTAALMVHIALTYLVGLRPHAGKGELQLHLRLRDAFSVEGYPFNGGSVMIEAQSVGAARRKLEVMTDVPLKLRVRTSERTETHDLSPGSHSLQA